MADRNPLAADLEQWLNENAAGCQLVIKSSAPLSQKLMCESYQFAYESTLSWLKDWESRNA